MSSNGENQFTSAKYQGHTAPVLSLAVSEDYSCLLSGSEDHTARLWDLRNNSRRRASLCIQTGGEVLSVAFTPKNGVEETPAEVSTSPFAKDHSIFLSVEHAVVEYDLRQVTSPIIHEPTRNLTPILQNQDEVNQVALAYHTSRPSQPKGKKKGNKKNNNKRTLGETKLYIAASDDAGTIRFMDSTSTNSSQVLHHDANAVVPACAFRPTGGSNNNKGNLELATGGTDCQIFLWDAFKPKRPISSISTSTAETETGKAQVCNPPMVYSLSWSQSGALLAAGLGDGSVSIMGTQNRNLVQTGHLPYAHDASVASVHFPSFCRDKSERVLFSGGSDGIVLCWDLGSTIVEKETTVNPKSMFSPDLLKGNSNQQNATTTPTDKLIQETEGLSLDSPEILFGIGKGEKINWMESAKYPDTLFVADTSNDITAYTIPMI